MKNKIYQKSIFRFTHAPESHGCKPVDEWLSARGSAPRNPEEKGATAVKPGGSTHVIARDLSREMFRGISNHCPLGQNLNTIRVSKILIHLWPKTAPFGAVSSPFRAKSRGGLARPGFWPLESPPAKLEDSNPKQKSRNLSIQLLGPWEPQRLMARVGSIILFAIILLNCIQGYLFAGDSTVRDELLGEKSGVRITMDLKGASLIDVLKMLSVQSGLNFISSEAVSDRQITCYLDNVILKDALDKLFAVNNLTYELDETSNIFIVKDWGAPSKESETRIYFLKYASATNSKTGSGIGSLREALGNVMSSEGKIIEDPATNSMIITDMPNKFGLIEQIINKLDIPVSQVMIEVEILDVDKSEVDRLGLNWSGSTWFTYAGPSNFTQDLFPPLNSLAGKSVYSMGWSSIANFLSTRSSTKFLARPKLFVLNNETAELKLSAQEGIGLITTVTVPTAGAPISTTTIERAETGVTLKITPQISMATGEVTLTLDPTVKEAITGLTSTSKDVEERSIKSTVRLTDGETIMLGGLIRNKESLSTTKVPFFGNIPIVGMLFRSKDVNPRKQREILVFLTPRIIKNSSSHIAKSKPLSSKMLSEREQEPFMRSKRNDIVSRVLGVYDTR